MKDYDEVGGDGSDEGDFKLFKGVCKMTDERD